jgi:hypothetical protein
VIEDSGYSLRDTSKRVRYEARDEEPSYMVCVDGQMVVVVVGRQGGVGVEAVPVRRVNASTVLCTSCLPLQ